VDVNASVHGGTIMNMSTLGTGVFARYVEYVQMYKV